jgi:hypothetical protein
MEREKEEKRAQRAADKKEEEELRIMGAGVMPEQYQASKR